MTGIPNENLTQQLTDQYKDLSILNRTGVVSIFMYQSAGQVKHQNETILKLIWEGYLNMYHLLSILYQVTNSEVITWSYQLLY
jgi:hypothetical protein